MSPGVILTAILSSSDNLVCVVLAGWDAMLRVSPRLAVLDNIFRLSRNFLPLSSPPFNSKQKSPPPFFICFFAISCWGWLGSQGYLREAIFGCPSRVWAICRAFDACRSILTSSVSRLLLNTHALKGDIAGPELRQNR